MLDLATESPTIEDLQRLTVAPAGAEFSGMFTIPGNRSLLVSIHGANPEFPFPWNKPVTFAIHGFQGVEDPAPSDCPTSVDFSYETCGGLTISNFQDLSVGAGEENGYTYEFLIDDKSVYPGLVPSNFKDFEAKFSNYGVYEGKLVVTSPEGCELVTIRELHVLPEVEGIEFDLDPNQCFPGPHIASFNFPDAEGIPEGVNFEYTWDWNNVLNPEVNGTFSGSQPANNNDPVVFEFNPPSPGEYSIALTWKYDIWECSANSQAPLSITPAPTLQAPVVNYDVCVEEILAEVNAKASGGVPPYSYMWSNGDTGPGVVDLPSGNYQYTVTDNRGCFVAGDVTVPSVEEVRPSIVIDEACISPAPCDHSQFPGPGIELQFNVSNVEIDSTSSYHYWVHRLNQPQNNNQIVSFGAGSWGKTTKAVIPSVFSGDSIYISILRDLSNTINLEDCPIERRAFVPNNLIVEIETDTDTIYFSPNDRTLPIDVTVSVSISEENNACILDDYLREHVNLEVSLVKGGEVLESEFGVEIDSQQTLVIRDVRPFADNSTGSFVDLKVVANFSPEGFNCIGEKIIRVVRTN